MEKITRIGLIVCLIIVFFVFFFIHRKTIHNGHVIIIDGASSSGKSSMIRELKSMLDHSYEYVAVDDYVTQVFLEQQKLNLPYEEFFKQIIKQCDLMYEKIRSLSKSGKNVIVDTVLSGLEGERSVHYTFEKLKGLPLTLVLAHCPMNVLVERITKRNTKAALEHKPEDERSVGTALSQFGHIYREQKKAHEITYGSVSHVDIESACLAARKEFGNNVQRFEKFKSWLLTQFDLKDKESVKITTRLVYDFIIDTSVCKPEECAHKLKNKLQEKN